MFEFPTWNSNLERLGCLKRKGKGLNPWNVEHSIASNKASLVKHQGRVFKSGWSSYQNKHVFLGFYESFEIILYNKYICMVVFKSSFNQEQAIMAPGPGYGVCGNLFSCSWILKTAFKILYVLTPFFKIGNLVTILKSPMQTRAPQKVPLLSSNGSFRCRKTFLGKIQSLRKTALLFYCNLFLNLMHILPTYRYLN